ncbi:MAG: gamma-glutamyltransferase family protein [Pseudomonadota bacterium]
MEPIFTTRPEIQGTFGVVSSTHWIGSAAGMSVLERGGNAFDAAVAVGFCLHVLEPHQNGPGGDMPVLFWSAKEEKVNLLCGQGVAPRAATIAAFRDLGLDLVPGTGPLAACVPGSFDAWMTLLRDHGTMEPEAVLSYAIDYAERGHPASWQFARVVEMMREQFTADWPTSAATYLPGGQGPKRGLLFRNPVLAATYRRLVAAGNAVSGTREQRIDAVRDAWYRGFVAEAVDRFCKGEPVRDSSGRRHRGLLTADDMAGWKSHYEAPCSIDYHGYTVHKCGPWSQGPTFLQQLALLKGYDLSAMDPVGDEFVHLLTECGKLAYADREAWYGDPDVFDVPMDDLLSETYAAERRKQIGDRASLEIRPGAPGGRQPKMPASWQQTLEAAGSGEPSRALADAGAGEPNAASHGPTGGDTCHIAVMDRWGNVVSAMPSGGWLQSSPVIPELGFCLGTRAQMFWLEEGLASSLAPGRRPRTTLSPSFVTRDGLPYMAFGTPGGDQQDMWSISFFLRHVHHGMNLQEAIDAPNFHNDHTRSSFYPRQAKPGSLSVEERFPPVTLEALRKRGHDMQVMKPWSNGRLIAAVCDRSQNPVVLRAAANPRALQGYAMGR